MVQDEKQTELCLRILQTCRAELCDLPEMAAWSQTGLLR